MIEYALMNYLSSDTQLRGYFNNEGKNKIYLTQAPEGVTMPWGTIRVVGNGDVARISYNLMEENVRAYLRFVYPSTEESISWGLAAANRAHTLLENYRGNMTGTTDVDGNQMDAKDIFVSCTPVSDVKGDDGSYIFSFIASIRATYAVNKPTPV